MPKVTKTVQVTNNPLNTDHKNLILHTAMRRLDVLALFDHGNDEVLGIPSGQVVTVTLEYDQPEPAADAPASKPA